MRCKMAISQPQYAAQFIDKEGNHYKFDDIGCMLAFVRQRNLKSSDLTFFFMDYMNTTHWLDATTAVLVKSARIDSPMVSGLAAFDGRRAAELFAAKNQGQVLAVAEVLEADSNSRPETKPYVHPTSTPN
jgi:copper chaperone NosL